MHPASSWPHKLGTGGSGAYSTLAWAEMAAWEVVVWEVAAEWEAMEDTAAAMEDTVVAAMADTAADTAVAVAGGPTTGAELAGDGIRCRPIIIQKS